MSTSNIGIITVPWIDGLKELSGYDNTGAEPRAMGDAFDLHKGAPKFGEENTKSLSGSVNIQWFQTVEQLSSVLRTKGGVSGVYKIFSGGLAADFLRNVNINSYSIYLLIHAEYETNEMRCDQIAPTLSDQTNITPKEFRAKYGDYFVIGKKQGGERIAVLELTASSSEVKDKLITATQFDVKSPIVSVSSNLSTGISKALSIAGVSLRLHLSEEGVGPDPLNLAQASGLGLKKVDKPKKKNTAKDATPQKSAAKTGTAKKVTSKAASTKDKGKVVKKDVSKDKKSSGATGEKKKPGVESAKDAVTVEAPKVDTNDDFIDAADVDSYVVDTNSPLIKTLINSADTLKGEVAKYGVARFAIVKPYTQLPNSPLDSVVFSPNGKEDLYEQMLKIYSRAKFIRDSVDYALDAAEDGHDAMDFSVSVEDLKKLRKSMSKTMGAVRSIDLQLRKGEKSVADVWNDLPDIPDMSALPRRFRPISLTKITAPLVEDPKAIMRDLKKYEPDLIAGDKIMNTTLSDDILKAYQKNCIRVGLIGREFETGLLVIRTGAASGKDVIASLRRDVQTNHDQILQANLNLRSSIDDARRRGNGDTEFLKHVDKANAVAERLTGDCVPTTMKYATATSSPRTAGAAMIDIWLAFLDAIKNMEMAVKAVPPTKSFHDVVSFDTTQWKNIANDFEAAAAMWTPQT